MAALSHTVDGVYLQASLQFHVRHLIPRGTKSTASAELGRTSYVQFLNELVQRHSIDWGRHTDFGDPKCLWLAPFWFKLGISAASGWRFQRVLTDVAVEVMSWNWCAQHKDKAHKSSVLPWRTAAYLLGRQIYEVRLPYCYSEIKPTSFTAPPLHGCKTCRLKKRNYLSNKKVNISWHFFVLPLSEL